MEEQSLNVGQIFFLKSFSENYRGKHRTFSREIFQKSISRSLNKQLFVLERSGGFIFR